MTRREELLRNAQAATATYTAAKQRHAHARKMTELGMTADVVGMLALEARAYSEWLRASDAFVNYRG